MSAGPADPAYEFELDWIMIELDHIPIVREEFIVNYLNTRLNVTTDRAYARLILASLASVHRDGNNINNNTHIRKLGSTRSPNRNHVGAWSSRDGHKHRLKTQIKTKYIWRQRNFFVLISPIVNSKTITSRNGNARIGQWGRLPQRDLQAFHAHTQAHFLFVREIVKSRDRWCLFNLFSWIQNMA